MTIDSFDSFDHRRFLAQDYAIFDPKRVEPKVWSALDPVALAPSTFANDPATLPQLVCLRSLSEDRRIGLLQHSDAWYRNNKRPLFSALLECPTGPEQLAGHIKRQLCLRTPEGGAAWLCFCNPAVFQHLCWQWGAEQLATLLGRVACWTFFVRERWHAFRPRVPPKSHQLRLSAHQWRQLDRIQQLNSCWSRLRRLSPAAAAESDASMRLDSALAIAAEHKRLSDPGDQILFAVQRLTYGESLHWHPQIIGRLEMVCSGVQSYARSCADLSDADYRRLAAEAIECEGAHA